MIRPSGAPFAARLAGVCAAAAAVRVVIVIVTRSDLHPTLMESDIIARNLLAGRGFLFHHLGTEYWAYQQPLGIWLITGVLWASGGSYAAVFAHQTLWTLALATAVGFLARRVTDARAAVLAAALVAFHPGLVWYDTHNNVPLGLDAFLFVAFVLTMVRLREHLTMSRALATGAIAGLSMLSRGTIGFALVAGLAWLVTVRRDQLRRASRCGAAMLVMAAVVVLPWFIRSSILVGRPVLVSSTAELLWRGNNARSTGTAMDSAGRTQFDLSPEFTKQLSGLTETEQYDLFMTTARAYIADKPVAFIGRTLQKFGYFWWFSPAMGYNYPAFYRSAYEIVYLAIVVLAAIGVTRVWRAGPAPRQIVALMATMMLCIALFQSVFYVEGRHRWAVEPFLLVLTAVGITTLFSRTSAMRHRDGPI